MPDRIVLPPWEYLFAYYLKSPHCLEGGIRTRNQADLSAAGSLVYNHLVDVHA